MPAVGAYLCPRGVWLVQARRRRDRFDVLDASEHPATLDSPADAVRHLVRALDDAGIARADVTVVLRGFDLGHHTLSLPPAPDAMLAPIIDRELRRLEPQITDPAVSWLPLPDDGRVSADLPPQRHVLVAAVGRSTAALLEAQLADADHRLEHLTALPAAIQRIAGEFDTTASTTAMLAPLPDGLFLGLFLSGGLRIAIEPPLLDQETPDGAAMAEEAELGATYVRQQFRGAELERAVIVAPAGLWQDTETILTQRLDIPVNRLDLDGLSTASIVALGGLLDSRSPAPLALAGRAAARRQNEARAVIRQTAFAAVAAAVIVAIWSMAQALDARRTDSRLREVRGQLDAAMSGVASVRQTADQRRLMRDASGLLRLSVADRSALQNSLAAIGAGVAGPIRLDSLQLDRGSNGWVASLTGTAAGGTGGGAVQALHDFYRDLPRRVAVEELALDQMAYADTSEGDYGSVIRFQLSFVLPQARD